MMGQERLATGSRAPLSDGGGAASGRGWVGAASRGGLNPVGVGRPECRAGVGELSAQKDGGVWELVVGRWEGIASLGGSDF